jgi:thiosulfate reductase cytochrome b subunit
MSERIYLYPKWIRIWHLINALLILTLIFTGTSMQYATTKHSLIRFDYAVATHNICGVLLTINYLQFLLGNIITPNGRYYKFYWRQIIDDLLVQFKYYISGIFKHQQPPFPVSKIQKFNPLQKFSYVTAMYLLVPLVFITGWAMLYPSVILTKFLGFSGIQLTDFLHVFTAFLIVLFLMIHVYFCTVGSTFTSNFKSMINGYHETH